MDEGLRRILRSPSGGVGSLPAEAVRMRSLIIGADGQVGRRLRGMLGAEAIATSRRADGAGTLALDLARASDSAEALDRVLAVEPIAAIYCVAAMTDVEACEDDVAAATAVNRTGPAFLAAQAARAHVPFVYFSTDYVFDGADGPYDEDAPVRPLSVYGRTKADGERAVRDADPSALIVRTNVVYGPDEREKNFIYGLRRTLAAGRRMRTPIDQYSSPTFNGDLAEAVVALVAAGARGVYHVGGPETMHRTAFARRAARSLGLDAEAIDGVPTSELGQRAPRPRHSGLRIDKLRRDVPQVRMRAVEEAIAAWFGGTAVAS